MTGEISSMQTKCRIARDKYRFGSYHRGICSHVSLLISMWTIVTVTPLTSHGQKLQLTNPLAVARGEETVEIPLGQVSAELRVSVERLRFLVANDAVNGNRIPLQLYGDKPGNPPDTLLLLVKLPARGKETVRFHIDPNAPAQQPLVSGREAPERKDDFAWENQLVTYRVYGPALEATGEIASGIDVWSKRVPNFIIDSFYKRDLEGARTHNPLMSYHKDNGVGLDSYYVGPTRGCGGTAVWSDGKLAASNNYTTLKVLGNGPIRFAFQVSYAPWQAGGHTVRETKIISLDAGTHLNKIVSTYTFDGAATLNIAAGLAVHEGADALVSANGTIASVWDTPQDPSAGRIATGLVALPEQEARTIRAAGHALMIFQRHSGESFTYFAGSGWSKADMATPDVWTSYLDSILLQSEHPIATTWTGH